jgi:hypothetical protein
MEKLFRFYSWIWGIFIFFQKDTNSKIHLSIPFYLGMDEMYWNLEPSKWQLQLMEYKVIMLKLAPMNQCNWKYI